MDVNNPPKMVSIGIDPSPLVTFVTLRWWPVVSPLARPTWIRVPARRGPRQRPGVSWPKWSFSTWKNKGNALKKGKTYSFFIFSIWKCDEMWWTIILKYANIWEGIRKKKIGFDMVWLGAWPFYQPKIYGENCFLLVPRFWVLEVLGRSWSFRSLGQRTGFGRKFMFQSGFRTVFLLGTCLSLQTWSERMSCCFWSSRHAKNGKEIFVWSQTNSSYVTQTTPCCHI